METVHEVVLLPIFPSGSWLLWFLFAYYYYYYYYYYLFTNIILSCLICTKLCEGLYLFEFMFASS
jgi:hypothetical protein